VANADQNLGRIVAVYGVQPAYLQRAIFVVILSFAFFLGMMFGFYYFQNFVYFLLASAFLLVYIVTLSSWLMQRRNLVKIYENGIEFRKHSYLWAEIESIAAGEPRGLDLKLKQGGKFNIPDNISQLDDIVRAVKRRI